MRTIITTLVVSAGILAATAASAQTTPATETDVYHVHFTKSAPGQAAAHVKALMTPDSSSSMPEHFVVLRHQEGDDWDFVVITEKVVDQLKKQLQLQEGMKKDHR